MLSERAQKLIAEQRSRYLASMPDKKQAIQLCLDQVCAAVDSGEPDLCNRLFQQVHRLAGSAGSYGFSSLGQAALVVDRYLIARSPDELDMNELASILQKLLTEIDNVIMTHG